MGAYTNANSDTRSPTVTSETRNPWALLGRMPTTTNSLMPSTKLDAISVTTGSVKKRSLPCRPRMAKPDMTVPLLFFLFFQTEHTLAAPPAAQGPRDTQETRRRHTAHHSPAISTVFTFRRSRCTGTPPTMGEDMHHRARPRDKGTGMGLFSRHHDDDYVSPFDVDDSPAYISIDSQTSQVDEPAYQQPKIARSENTQTENARSKTTQSKSDRKPGGATKRQRRSWVAVIAIIVFALGSNLVAHIISAGGSSDSDDSSYSFKSPSQGNKPTRVKTGETTSFGNRKATVTIAKATTGPTDYDGHKTVIITYHWKNTGDANTTFGELAMDLQVYQSGIGLNKTYLYSRGGSSIEGYKTQSDDIKIAKGEESDATIAYQLNDATGDLYVVANQATRYHEGIVSAFKAPTSGTQYEQVQPDDIAPAPKATEAEKRKMKRISSYSGDALVSIDDVTTAPDDYQGRHTIIVTITWVNQSEANEPLSNAAKLTVTQDGSQLEMNYYTEPPLPQGYENMSFSRSVQPGVLAKATVSYVVEDPGQPVTVRLSSTYGGNDMVTKKMTPRKVE